jgi:cytosine deaminase
MPTLDELDRKFLDAAYEEAQKGLAEGGIPIGSVLVRNGEIIGRGHNRRVQKGDPVLHGEMDAIQNAGRQKTYKDVTCYTTLSPCMMCTGTIIQFGISRVVVAESKNFKGFQDVLSLAGVEVKDVGEARCTHMMADFIARNPSLWNEDIGE